MGFLKLFGSILLQFGNIIWLFDVRGFQFVVILAREECICLVLQDNVTVIEIGKLSIYTPK
jgi:hypothetical protein